MAKTKVTKKDFEFFKKECEKWRDKLNLKDWEVHYILGDTDEDNRAEYSASVQARQCTIHLADTQVDWLPLRGELQRTAFHEMLELRIQELRQMAMKACSYDDVDKETHKLIAVFEGLLL